MPAPQRLFGVDDQVDENLVELISIPPDRRQIWRQAQGKRDPRCAQGVAGNLQRGLNHIVDLDIGRLSRLLTRHGQEGFDNARATVSGIANLFSPHLCLLVCGGFRQHKGLANHNRERIVQLVRNPGKQFA